MADVKQTTGAFGVEPEWRAGFKSGIGKAIHLVRQNIRFSPDKTGSLNPYALLATHLNHRGAYF